MLFNKLNTSFDKTTSYCFIIFILYTANLVNSYAEIEQSIVLIELYQNRYIIISKLSKLFVNSNVKVLKSFRIIFDEICSMESFRTFLALSSLQLIYCLVVFFITTLLILRNIFYRRYFRSYGKNVCKM